MTEEPKTKIWEENPGEVSSIRVTMLVGMGIIFAVFVAAAFGAAEFPEIPQSVLVLIGILCGAKTIQRPLER